MTKVKENIRISFDRNPNKKIEGTAADYFNLRLRRRQGKGKYLQPNSEITIFICLCNEYQKHCERPQIRICRYLFCKYAETMYYVQKMYLIDCILFYKMLSKQ